MTSKSFYPLFEDFINTGFLLRSSCNAHTGFPFENIVREGDDYVLEYALAGYTSDEVDVTLDKNILTIKSVLENTSKDERSFIKRGITKKNFKRQLSLDEFLEVDKISLKNGILTIKLVKNVPEDKKPKTFKIET